MRRASIIAVLLMGLAPRAQAYESECRVDPGGANKRLPADYEGSICGNGVFCEDGYGFARGTLLSEHAYLVYTAMQWAGVPSLLLDDREVLRYFTWGQAAPWTSGNVSSLEAAAPGRMTRPVNMSELLDPNQIVRPTTIAEFAAAVDGAYSMADYLSGNEHCPVTPGLDGSLDDLQSCHTTIHHMGPVNSNHFAPQHGAMYAIYHGIALQIMDRCKFMKEAFDNAQSKVSGPHNFSERMKRAEQQCEKEGLAFEAVAGHFLGDAWSSGHMWQRWGSPVFPTDAGYAATVAVAAASGIIHGWKSVVEARFPLTGKLIAEDPMCEPGTTPAVLDQSFKNGPVTWSYPAGTVPISANGNFYGAGDGYLLQCTTPNQGWSLYHNGVADASAPVGPQWLRMMTCLTRGIQEVYQRGPMLNEAATPLVPDKLLDPAVPPAQAGQPQSGALSPVCWEQRVDNQSFYTGGGLGPTGLNLFRPNYAFFYLFLFFVYNANITPADSTRRRYARELNPFVAERVRADLKRMGAYVQMRASRAPGGTDLADLGAPEMRQLAGVSRNSDFLDQIKKDQVPYIDQRSVEAWTHLPGVPCANDDECKTFDPHSYCDSFAAIQTSASASMSTPLCALNETIILRSFREAETPYWCAGDTWNDFENARWECQNSGNESSCAACAQVLAPHLRNGCDPGMDGYQPIDDSGFDNRSMCDILHDTGTMPITGPMVYAPYERQSSEDWSQAAERTLLEICHSGPDGNGPPAAINYGFSASPPTASDSIAASTLTRTIVGATCGRANTPTNWFRWSTQFDVPDRTYTIRLTATGKLGAPTQRTDLELAMFSGPRCDPNLDLVQTGTATDTDGDGKPDSLVVNWSVVAGTPSEICLRVRPLTNTVHTDWKLALSF